MDFMNRNGQQSGRVASAANQSTTPAPSHETFGAGTNGKKPSASSSDKKHFPGWNNTPGWLRIANLVLLFSVTIVAVSAIFLMRNANPSEGQYVSSSHYQAVFLSNGQVYFGKIQAVNAKYIDLTNIFYLNSNATSSTDTSKTSSSSNNYTLIKLGCELHGPYDRMVINADQVTFWENLQDSGQVVKTIKNWQKENPNGQTCSSSSSNSSSTQSTTNSSSATSPQSSATGTSSTTSSTSKNQ